ncbi:hypothetical protein [Roseibium aestuarii]|uniref:HNH endonuclease n=1 Tax=Roseibium aestuarii TaxID=2600299 RepID=A0ABW4JW20_9HYPH|nr:hypothetical protein [Roseibium aestuarii]
MTGYYNGYSPRQRGKIAPAFRRLTGRPAPFEGEPCAICGDPDRAPNEWHAEDYSEPFDFTLTGTCPICKPCHSRLHKRFNALPGEWDLFCRHLASGGYGREFVALFSIAERMRLCADIAAGRSISLARGRDREALPAWWLKLTLDRESLEAP